MNLPINLDVDGDGRACVTETEAERVKRRHGVGARAAFVFRWRAFARRWNRRRETLIRRARLFRYFPRL